MKETRHRYIMFEKSLHKAGLPTKVIELVLVTRWNSLVCEEKHQLSAE